MDSQSQNPDLPPLHELEGGLRCAVEAVRTEAIPQDAMDRATERTSERMNAASTARLGRRRLFKAVASMAAVLCLTTLGVTFFNSKYAMPYVPQGTMGENLFGYHSESEVASTDISLDGEVPTNYNVDRIEEVSVPGPVAPTTPSASSNTPGVLRYPMLPPLPSPAKAEGADDFDIFKDQKNGGGAHTEKQPERKDAALAKVAELQRRYQAMQVSKRVVAGAVSKDDLEGVKLELQKAIQEAKGAIPETPDQGHEAYSHFLDNPFLRPTTNPLSTFALAVDTASYSNVRRFLLQENRLPPPDAVRIAELVNYFPYTYAQPKGEHPVAFTLDLADVPLEPKHHLARIGLKGRSSSTRSSCRRATSSSWWTPRGSMNAPNRLAAAQASLALLVEQLTANDRVAIVAYAGSAGLVLPPTPGNEKDDHPRAPSTGSKRAARPTAAQGIAAGVQDRPGELHQGRRQPRHPRHRRRLQRRRHQRGRPGPAHRGRAQEAASS